VPTLVFKDILMNTSSSRLSSVFSAAGSPTGRLQHSAPQLQRLPIPGVARLWKEQAAEAAQRTGLKDLDLSSLEQRILAASLRAP